MDRRGGVWARQAILARSPYISRPGGGAVGGFRLRFPVGGFRHGGHLLRRHVSRRTFPISPRGVFGWLGRLGIRVFYRAALNPLPEAPCTNGAPSTNGAPAKHDGWAFLNFTTRKVRNRRRPAMRLVGGGRLRREVL